MLLANLKNLLAINKSQIFYILAVVFFVAFLGVLIWFLLSNRTQKKTPKPTKSWTIESAKKFLESNNMVVSEDANAKANENSNVKEENEETKEIESEEETKTTNAKKQKPVNAPNLKKVPTQKTNAPKTIGPKPKAVAKTNDNKELKDNTKPTKPVTTNNVKKSNTQTSDVKNEVKENVKEVKKTTTKTTKNSTK